MRHGSLGEFEHRLLLAILQLEERAHAPAIARYLDEAIGRETSRGALYSSLARLEQKGFLEWEVDDPGGEEGGGRKRLFSVTGPGLEALRATRSDLLTLWDGLDAKLEG